MKLKLILYIAVAVCWSAPAQSAETDLCKQALTPPHYLADVGKAASKAKTKICSAETNIDKVQAYLEFLDEIKDWFNPYGGFKDGKSVTDEIKLQYLTENALVSIAFNLSDEITVGNKTFIPNDESKCIEVSQAADCTSVTGEFIDLFTDIHKLQVDAEIFSTITHLQKLRADWNPFLEQMKGQTWLELLVNRHAYRNNTDKFSGPPSSQWIVLHPTVLIENLSSAADGENLQEALGLEIIGMNWWKQDRWYFPSGVSALAVYSDRADVKDVGYGLAFHFLSNYTMGYTNHDGKDGFYFSMDIVKLFQDRKKVFESYTAAFD